MEQKKNQPKRIIKGSILIPVLIIFFIISVVALSIVQQTITGIKITSDSQRSHQSYQYSDQLAESVLNKIKFADNTPANYLMNIFHANNIPENIYFGWWLPGTSEANAFTYFMTDGGSTGVFGYTDLAGTTEPSSSRLIDIKSIKTTGSSGSLQRGILVPLPNRINNTVSGFTVTKETVGPNTGDLKISWDATDVGSSANIGGAEIRVSNQSNLRRSVADSTDLHGWFRAASLGISGTTLINLNTANSLGRAQIFSSAAVDTDGCKSFTAGVIGITKNVCYIKNVGATDWDNGGCYYFTIKLKNYNNFNLDSAYLTEKDSSVPGYTVNNSNSPYLAKYSTAACTWP